MKTWAAGAVAALLAFGLAPRAGIAGPYEKGDVDGNGVVDAADVAMLTQVLRQARPPLTGAAQDAADVAPIGASCGGGASCVDAADLGLLARGLAGQNVDGDGLGADLENQAGTSPFLADSDIDGTPDDQEDSDGDGLRNFEEAALGSPAGDPPGQGGIGSADASYVAAPANPAYLPDSGPTVIFYASRPSANLARLAPLKALLEADGYQVSDFTVPPPSGCLNANNVFIGAASQACLDYHDALIADVLVLAEPLEALSSEESNTILSLFSAAGQTQTPLPGALLVLGESDSTLGPFLDTLLGSSFAGTSITNSPPSCPDGASTCPSGWSTFRTASGSLDATHPITPGRDASESVSAFTTFLGGALTTPAIQFTPDSRHLTAYEPVAVLGGGATRQTPSGPASAAGLSQLIAIEVPRGLCNVTPVRAVVSSDLEAFTALIDNQGKRRGLQAVPLSTNQQYVLNVFHWLDQSIDPMVVPETQLITANVVCPGAQQDDPTFDPAVPNPSYDPGVPAGSAPTGPRVLVDNAHNNNSHVNCGSGNYCRFKGFATLLKRDGYRVEDSPHGFTTSQFAAQLAGAEVLVIVNPNVALTAAEFAPVESWVRQGGALLFVVDHQPFPANVAQAAVQLGIEFPVTEGVNVAPPDCTPRPLGCRIENTVFATSPLSVVEGAIVPSHPIALGRNASEQLDVVRTFVGSAYRVVASPPSGASYQAVIHQAATAQYKNTTPPVSAAGLLQGLAIQLGQGRVYVSGEAAMLTAQSKGPVLGYGKFGMNSETGNQQLVLNIIHWLDGLL